MKIILLVLFSFSIGFELFAQENTQEIAHLKQFNYKEANGQYEGKCLVHSDNSEYVEKIILNVSLIGAEKYLSIIEFTDVVPNESNPTLTVKLSSSPYDPYGNDFYQPNIPLFSEENRAFELFFLIQ